MRARLLIPGEPPTEETRATDRGTTMLYDQPRKLLNPATQRFLFATGIECSYPTVEWKGQRIRQDE
jgi:hypothetical protein